MMEQCYCCHDRAKIQPHAVLANDREIAFGYAAPESGIRVVLYRVAHADF